MSDESIGEFDVVFVVSENGACRADFTTYAPEVFVSTDDDGQILSVHEAEMIEDVRRQGWEMLTGWSGQWQYSGPIMHASEYFGGRLREHVLSVPGTYALVVVTGDCDDDPDAGWAVVRKLEGK